ncbi:MAG: hypothetical protein IH598_02150 [Bacteroidales bacterium]|nr:hypothetical protein [Bacteroidales bacterium]
MRRLPNITGILKLTFPVLIIIVLSSQQLNAQTTPVKSDTLEIHSAKKAAIMSAVLPGLGQGYNKKYWKIPIIYAGFGTLYYFIRLNGTEYRNFRDAYNIVAAGDTANFIYNDYIVRYNANLNQLQEGRNYYRRNLELTYILTGLLYILQIVDASVDANLYDFDVSEDLTLRFEPMSNYHYFAYRPSPGLTLRYKF